MYIGLCHVLRFRAGATSDNRHLTHNIGQNEYVNISRGLARTILFKHLTQLDIAVHTFQSSQDPGWLKYHRLAKVRDVFLAVRTLMN